jgi:hypothetical protein
LEVGDFGVGIKSASDCEGLAALSLDVDVLVNLEVTTLHVDVELLSAVKTESVSVLTILELEGEDSHTNEVGSVDSLVGLSDHSADTLEEGTLGSPISGRTGTVFLSGEEDSINTVLLVLEGGIEDSHFLTGGYVDGVRSNLVDHLVDKSNVSEGSTSHNLVVASAGTVGVKVLFGNTAIGKVASSRGVLSDLTGRGDMISGDRVAHVDKAVGTLDTLGGGELVLSALEEGRVVDVG